MERYLRPERFDADPNQADAAKQWLHWFRTFENFLTSLASLSPNKLDTLINYLAPSVYEFIGECTTYEDAINILKDTYVKPKNEVFARHLLATCKQEGQTLDQYLCKLKTLAKECDFKSVTAEQNRNNAIRDAFITGLTSNEIRQRILEQKNLNLENAFDLARSLELAHKQSASYSSTPCGASATPAIEEPVFDTDSQNCCSTVDSCYFCGYRKHPRARCPAKDAICKTCLKKGHFAKVCRSGASNSKHKGGVSSATLAASIAASSPSCLAPAVVLAKFNNVDLHALIDTGSSESFISPSVVRKYGWKTYNSSSMINMASTHLTKTTSGHCYVKLSYNGREYKNVRLSLLPDLCSDVILGHDFLKKHKELSIKFKGEEPPLSISAVSAAKVTSPPLFSNLTPECKPIATKSRRRHPSDEQFIEQEVEKLLADKIIEPSSSPWRAQVLVTVNERHKKRMVVDYSQTINRYTLLDAYPLPRMDDMIEKIAQYEYFSTLDLKSAYHQVPILEEEKPYTAFEACGNLYQFSRIPFGVTNGVACFQRVIDNIIKENNIEGTFAYVDNVTVCGTSKEDHDMNLQNFLATAKKQGLTFNQDKSIIATKEIRLLGYIVSRGIIKPDPERFEPLRNLSPPKDLASQRRLVGMFSYYSTWISHFSDKIQPLASNDKFPIPKSVHDTVEEMKQELEKAFLITVDPNVSLTVETDASDSAIAATLNQEGRPVAFFSRTLNKSEKNHSAIEKEAQAIVEAIKKWRHYLIGNNFRLVTDQRSVSFIYGNELKGKVKNEKIQRWKLELSCFHYDVVYRPGPENLGADALSRQYCSASQTELYKLHEALSHPGVTRMLHFVRSRNMAYSVEDIKRMTSQCNICSHVKPKFHRSQSVPLIKATQPFERLSIDFKGPLPSSSSQNKYLLTIVDEFSRFPFAFPCKDMTSGTVINCLTQLFAIFGMPAYIHSDNGPSFISEELRSWLQEKGIACSRSTVYNPRGNGQVEKLNDTLWKAIQLSLQTKGLPINNWEVVLTDALHSIRSLLCTSINCTPHERMFSFPRRSTSGCSLPSWLLSPGPVLMKRNVRSSKYDPMVDEVELLHCNPHYAQVRLKDGKETTVSLRQLAPAGNGSANLTENIQGSVSQVQGAEPSAPPSLELSDQTATLEQHEAPESGTETLSETMNPRVESNPTPAKSEKSTYFRTREYNLRSGKK